MILLHAANLANLSDLCKFFSAENLEVWQKLHIFAENYDIIFAYL